MRVLHGIFYVIHWKHFTLKKTQIWVLRKEQFPTYKIFKANNSVYMFRVLSSMFSSAPELKQFSLPKIITWRYSSFWLRLFQWTSVWKYGQSSHFLPPPPFFSFINQYWKRKKKWKKEWTDFLLLTLDRYSSRSERKDIEVKWWAVEVFKFCIILPIKQVLTKPSTKICQWEIKIEESAHNLRNNKCRFFRGWA